jgi:hypothetical protein
MLAAKPGITNTARTAAQCPSSDGITYRGQRFGGQHCAADELALAGSV